MSAADRETVDPLLIWTQLLTTTAALQREILEVVARATTVATGWLPAVVLLLDAPGERLPMSALSAHLSMTSGGFTKLADRLEHAGLLTRIPSVQDRRVVYAALTPAGSQAARQAVAIAGAQVEQRVLTQFSITELADIGERMTRVLTAPAPG